MARIAVVGGGPSGFMAALTAAADGAADRQIEVFDAGTPLATILRTGGGRCNITNSRADLHELAACYPRGGKFLLSAFSRFGPRETMEWFRSRGLALVEEEEGRIFPRSGRAEDVRDLLAGQARSQGIRTHARTAVEAVQRSPGTGFTVVTQRGRHPFDRVVIATGGDWKDGSRSGYRLARSLGHSVGRLAPSLTALIAAERWPGRLAGLTLRGARCTALYAGEKVVDERGDLLFTHEGVSGPLAFRVSSRCAFLEASPASPLLLELSALPGSSREGIERELDHEAATHPRRQVVSSLHGILPRSLADAVAALAGVDPGLVGAQLSREKRRALAALVNRLPLTIIERRRGGEMVTAGGVKLSEVDPRTMESRLVPGLFFCGEVLDIDGFTGGFNLQAAWSTGYLAGLAAGS